MTAMNLIEIRERYRDIPSVPMPLMGQFSLDMGSVPLSSTFLLGADGLPLRIQRRGIPLYSLGWSGSGKSSVPMDLARWIGAPVFRIQPQVDGMMLTSIPSVQDVFLPDGTPSGDQVMTRPLVKTVARLRDEARRKGMPLIVVIEDMGAALANEIKAGLLGFLLNLVLAGETIGEAIIFANGNPVEITPGGTDMESPVMGRLACCFHEDASGSQIMDYARNRFFREWHGQETKNEIVDWKARCQMVDEGFKQHYLAENAKLRALLHHKPSMLRAAPKPNHPTAEPRKHADFVAHWWATCRALGYDYAPITKGLIGQPDTEADKGYEPWYLGTAALCGVGWATEAIAYLTTTNFPDVLSELTLISKGHEPTWKFDESRPDIAMAYGGNLISVLGDRKLPDRDALGDAAVTLLHKYWPLTAGDIARPILDDLCGLKLVDPLKALPVLQKLRKLTA